jgi:membrane fusion protein, multidrug efflux system
VVQRIPVKIVLDNDAAIELRPGMSVIPSIQTQTNPGEAARRVGRANVAFLGSTR